jgi:hypothetical protein
MKNVLKRAAAQRVGGERPSIPVALGAAISAGVAAAVVTYKLLRS